MPGLPKDRAAGGQGCGARDRTGSIGMPALLLRSILYSCIARTTFAHRTRLPLTIAREERFCSCAAGRVAAAMGGVAAASTVGGTVGMSLVAVVMAGDGAVRPLPPRSPRVSRNEARLVYHWSRWRWVLQPLPVFLPWASRSEAQVVCRRQQTESGLCRDATSYFPPSQVLF